MTVDLDKVKSRIRKILATANNHASTDGEVKTAIEFAKLMMDRHHLSEEDLEEKSEEERIVDVQKAPKARFCSVIGKRRYAWEQWLASFIADLVGVLHYIDNGRYHLDRDISGKAKWDENGETHRGKCFVFYGVAEDAKIAKEMYDEFRLTIISMARLKWGGCYKGDGGRYCEGFVVGLRSQLGEVRRDERRLIEGSTEGLGNALIVRRNHLIALRKQEEDKERIIREWLENEEGVKLVKGDSPLGAIGSHQAYESGKADGRAADTNVNRTLKLEAK